MSRPSPRRLRVEHSTGFRYGGRVVSSYNEARMTPMTTPWQTTLDARVTVEPLASTFRYWDYWGTQVTAFDVHVPHDRLTVTATSVVETAPSAQVHGDTDAPWDLLRSDASRDRFAEMLTVTPRTGIVDEALALAADAAGDLDPDAAARAVCDLVGERMEYVPGATGVHTSAAEAWRVGKGVCQDFAHVTVGLLRHLGIPAAYVSGYLHPRKDAAVGEKVRGESHAWVEWWAGDWRAWDPTNGKPAASDHVVVARGRDYSDVPPLKGIYSGAATSALFVTVEVQRLT